MRQYNKSRRISLPQKSEEVTLQSTHKRSTLAGVVHVSLQFKQLGKDTKRAIINAGSFRRGIINMTEIRQIRIETLSSLLISPVVELSLFVVNIFECTSPDAVG